MTVCACAFVCVGCFGVSECLCVWHAGNSLKAMFSLALASLRDKFRA